MVIWSIGMSGCVLLFVFTCFVALLQKGRNEPTETITDSFLLLSQLAVWNNEVEAKRNPKLNDNWARTQKFVWVKATKDTMVWPPEGEHWGAAVSDSKVVSMKDTEWYQKDLFGLKTAEEAGKNEFLTFDGDHLQFSLDDLHQWVMTYFSGSTID